MVADNPSRPISSSDAIALSDSLLRLGCEAEDIVAEMRVSGYCAASEVAREALLELARLPQNQSRLRSYWAEWAKERLSGLAGPMNILKGRYASNIGYRSPLLAELREDFAKRERVSSSHLISNQIEPTLRLNMERGVDNADFRILHSTIKRVRAESAAALGYSDTPEFKRLNEPERYNLLIEKLRDLLVPSGFKLDSHRKTGVVFRKSTSNRRWDFVVVDVSKAVVSTGLLSTSFGLTIPKKAVLPALKHLSCVATFEPDDVVPQYRWSSEFEVNSYAEFALSIASIAHLAKMLFRRLDSIMAGTN